MQPTRAWLQPVARGHFVKANWVRRINHSQALTRRWALLFASSDWMQEEPAKNESQIAL